MQAFIASDSETLGARIRQGLLREGQECPAANLAPLGHAAGRVAEAEPGLVVLVMPADAQRALQVLAELRGLTKVPILAVGPASDSKLILRTIRAGADQYLDETELETELAESLQRLQEEGGQKKQIGRVIAVLGASGGCGASTLTVNLASALAKEHGGALVIDLKPDTGDLAALLDLRPSHTLMDLCQHSSRLDRSVLERSVSRHNSGVCLLASPRLQASAIVRQAPMQLATQSGRITSEGLQQVVQLGRASFPYVIGDVNPSYREEQAYFLRQADLILLVLRLDFTSLRNTRRALDHLELVGVSRDRVRLVVNRHGQSNEVPAEKAEDALHLKIFHNLPEDAATINHANNYGLPAVLSAPRTKVSRSFLDLAKRVAATAQVN